MDVRRGIKPHLLYSPNKLIWFEKAVKGVPLTSMVMDFLEGFPTLLEATQV